MHVILYRTGTLEMVSSHLLEMCGDSQRHYRGNGGFALSHDSCQLLCTQYAATCSHGAVEEWRCWIWDKLLPYSAPSHPRKLTIGYAIHHSTFNPVDPTQLISRSWNILAVLRILTEISARYISPPTSPLSLKVGTQIRMHMRTHPSDLRRIPLRTE